MPPGAAHPKRSQTSTTDNSAKEEGGVQLRKPSTPGSRGAPPSSPLLGNANNPNKADIPDRRKGVATGPSVSPCSASAVVHLPRKQMLNVSLRWLLQNNTASAGMTRRNTYVCSDRNNADRLSVIPNGKENR